MKRHEQMSKWYPLEGYEYADFTACDTIEKMVKEIRQIRRSDIIGSAEIEKIETIYEKITELAFEYKIALDHVMDYVDFLYACDKDAQALDLVSKVFAELNAVHNPNRRYLERVINTLEEIAYNMGYDESYELLDDVLMARVKFDV